MPCGCKKYHKKRKRGSGLRLGRSSKTWTPAYLKKGSGMSFRGGGLKKKRRRKRGSGMALTGSGMNFAGGGYIFDGSGFKTLVGTYMSK